MRVGIVGFFPLAVFFLLIFLGVIGVSFFLRTEFEIARSTPKGRNCCTRIPYALPEGRMGARGGRSAQETL
jgi:hypothetical protein